VKAADERSKISAIVKSAVGLGLFAALTAGSIALTHHLTSDAIAEQKQLAEAASLYALVPESLRRPALLHSTVQLPEPEKLNRPANQVGWLAKDEGQIRRVVLPVTAPNGYSGPIELLVGLSAEGEITGVQVLSHRETPGLGDRIEPSKSAWLRQFIGQSLASTDDRQWALKRSGGEFDAISGATITSRAVTSALHNTLTYYRRYSAQILPGKTERLIPANIALAPPAAISTAVVSAAKISTPWGWGLSQ